jgi:hypothetical protein
VPENRENVIFPKERGNIIAYLLMLGSPQIALPVEEPVNGGAMDEVIAVFKQPWVIALVGALLLILIVMIRYVTSHDVTSHDVTSHDVTSHDVTSHDVT